MAWKFIEQEIGLQPITDIETTAQHPLGKIARAEEPTYGHGEFIYLQGVASTGVGDIVEYNSAFQTGKASIAVTASEPLAVAMSACTASYYGWYQISGYATVSKASATSFAADAAFGATSGEAVAAATGLFVHHGAVVAAASGASAVVTALVMINRPAGPGAT